MNKEYEEIRQLLDKAGLIDKRLTFGCIISTYEVYPDEAEEYWIDYRICAEKTEYPNAFEKKEYFLSTKYPNGTSASTLLPKKHFENPNGKNYRILGHDFDIREVMQWFSSVQGPFSIGKVVYFFSSEGEIRRLEQYAHGRAKESILLKLDITKPLKDQDCSSLLELMKSIS